MAVQNVNEIIDVAAVQEQGKILRDELTKSQQKLVEVYDLIQKYKNSPFTEAANDAKKLAVALNEATKATTSARQENEKFEKTLQDTAVTEKELAKAAAAVTKAQSEQNVALQGYKLQAAEANKAAKQQAREANGLLDAYERLKLQYNETAASAKAFGIELGVESKEFLETAAAAQKYYTQLLTVEKAVGQGQRQVGQYENATRGLHGSINQITRELPAFTYSVQTGFLAISNNLPILFDEIGKISAQNKVLQAEGKKTQSVLKSIAAGIFSFGTILSVGVTLLTVYGKEIGEFIKTLFKSKQAIDQTEESVKILGETLASSDYTDAVAIVTELTENIALAKEGFLDKDKVLKQYNETLGKTTGEVETLGQAEFALTENGKEYIQMMLLKAAANYALQQAAKAASDAEIQRQKDEQRIENIERANKRDTRPDDGLGAFNRIAAAGEARANKKTSEERIKSYEEIAADFQKRAAQIAKDNKFDFFGGQFDDKSKDDTLQKIKDALYEAQKLEIEGRKQAAEIIAANEQKTFGERIAAQQQIGREEIALINLSAAYEVSKEDVTAQEKKNIRTKAAQDRIATEAETNGVLRDLLNAQAAFELNIITTLAERRAKEAQEADKIAGKIQERAKGIQEQSQITLTILDAQYAREQKIALENYRAGLLSKEEYEQTLLDIQMKFSDAALVETIEAAKQRLKLLKVGTKEHVDAQKAIADAELARIKLTEDAETKSLNKRKKQVETFLNGVNDITRNLTSSINAIFDVGFDRRAADLETQQNILEENSEREIENITNSTLSEEEKQRRIQIAQATTDAKKQEIERRQRQIEMERARFQKAVDIASIITGTAVAVVAALGMKPYTPLNIALAAATGAAGAAQLAAAIATPLPKFKHGTSNAPEGWALTDEAGAEGYIEPGGKTYVGNDKPTLRYLKSGTKIIPHDELNKSIGINSMLLDIAGMINKPVAANTIDYSNANKNTDRIVKAIRSTRVKQQPAAPDLGRIGYLLKNVYQ